MGRITRRITRFVRGAMNKARVSSMIPSPPRYVRLLGDNEDNGRTRKGYVPVVVAGGAGDFVIDKGEFMGHPSIDVLQKDEFGYRQEGVLRIPCEPDRFREIINNLLAYE